jgi:hypothetical protein
MKTFRLLFLAVITFLLFFAGCFVNIIVDQPEINPGSPSLFKLVSVAALAAYEVVVRIIPSVGDYSVVSFVIKWLKRISDTLNARRD